MRSFWWLIVTAFSLKSLPCLFITTNAKIGDTLSYRKFVSAYIPMNHAYVSLRMRHRFLS